MAEKEENVKACDLAEDSRAPKRPARSKSGGGGRGRPRWRPYSDQEHVDGTPKEPSVDEASPVIQAFRGYQISLDRKHDKYERLVKKSRDVTIESKRVIFLLHRITGESDMTTILKEAEEKLCQIRETSLRDIAVELEDEDIFQYIKAISPGLQEYVEAVTFLYYTRSECIATLSDIEKELVFEEGEKEGFKNVKLIVPPSEYMLGLADLTGELMRKSINSVAQGNMDTPFKLALLLKNLYEGFTSLMAGREISRKTRTLKQSLEKVERACYNINVRGSEIPKHMLTDVFVTSQSQSSPNRETEDIF